MIDLGALKLKITVDNTEGNKKLDDSKSKLEAFKKVGSTITKGIAITGAAAITAVAGITKAAVDSYGEYEQLVGGIETLFGDSADKMKEYASKAYKTAQISANDYMSLATSFSASLLQSLGGDTEKAAKVADSAIIDMADNANKMGSSMESIQNAYQGFAKQNFTMLDNLKLGYGGTKEEMQRLLSDATALSGIKYDISSSADITEAIHVIQTDLGIAGTSAKEASTTIQGSFASTKAAFQDLIRAFGDKDADIKPYLDAVIETATTAFENLLPVIERVLEQIGNALPTLFNLIATRLPPLLADLLPKVLEGATALLDGLIANLPMLFTTLGEILLSGVNYIIANLPMIIELALTLIQTLADGIINALPTLIPALIDTILQIVMTLTDPDSLGQLVDTAIVLIQTLADGLLEALPQLIDALPMIIENIVMFFVNNWPKLLECGFNLIIKLAAGLIKAIPQLLSKIPQILKTIFTGLEQGYENIKNIGKNLVSKIWDGIKSAANWIKDKVSGFISSIFGGGDVDVNVNANTKTKKFAEGGILTKATTFGFMGNTQLVGGEAGTEAVIPLKKLPDLIKKMKLIPAQGMIKSTLNIDGREMGVSLMPYMAEELGFAGA